MKMSISRILSAHKRGVQELHKVTPQLFPVITLTAVLSALIPYVTVQLIGGILGVLLLPFGMVGWFLFTYNRLDETVNAQYYPDMIGKGIKKK